MKKELEVFYDLACPYCYQGLMDLRKFLNGNEEVYLNYIACEAHPKPEPAKMHSDLAARVVYFLKDNDLDVNKFNFLVYEAYFEKDLSIEDKSLLTEFAKMCGADEESVREVLNSNKYQDVLESANTLVWSELKFAAVPSYRGGERTVGSGGGVLVDIDKVAELLEE